jgi:hypothetical protein
MKSTKIMKNNTIMHINISTHIERIGIDITIMNIYLIQIGQIKFILEVRMIDFMN